MDPIVGTGTAEDTGRSCPYCRFALKEGVDLARCPECQSPHHAECWTENGGCAIFGCAAAPGQPDPTQQPPIQPPASFPPQQPGGQMPPASPQWTVPAQGKSAPPPPPSMPSVTPPSAAPPPVTAPASARGGRGLGQTGLIAAILVLALGVGGAGAAIFIDKSGGGNEPTTTTGPTTIVETEPAMDGLLPNISTAEMASQIKTVFDSHHQALANGDYQAAFEYLSDRKQRYPSADNPSCRDSYCWYWGADGSGSGNKSLGDLLTSPVESRVVIKRKFKDEGDVEIWASVDAPACPGGRWSGITWMRFEDDEWNYDPGYATTRPNFPETYGWDSGHERSRYDKGPQGGLDRRLFGANCPR